MYKLNLKILIYYLCLHFKLTDRSRDSWRKTWNSISPMQQLELDSDFKDSDEDEGDEHSLNVKSLIFYYYYSLLIFYRNRKSGNQQQ